MKRSSKQLVLGLFVGALLLWLSLRRIDFSRVGAIFARVDPLLVLVAIAVGQLANVLRAWRWRLLLPRPVGTGKLFAALMIGYFANNALPARLGELLRLESLRCGHGVPRGEGLTSIVVEKVFDGLTLCLLLGGMLLVHDFPDWVAWIAHLSFLLFAGALLFALLCLRYRGGLLRIVARLLRPLGRFSAPLLHFAESSAAGLETLRRPVNLLACLLLSGTIWGIEMVSVWILFRAASVALGPFAALFVVTILSLGMLVPSPPGFVGTYEYFGSRALMALSVERSVALAVTFLLHLQFLLTTTVVGFLCLTWSGKGLGFVHQVERGSSDPAAPQDESSREADGLD